MFLLTLSLILVTASSPALAGLIGFYSFDDTGDPLKDDSNNLNPLSPVGGTANPTYSAASGFEGGAFSFDGGDRLIAPIDINPGTLPQVTIGAWVQTNTTLTGLHKIMGTDNGGGDRVLGLDERGNGFSGGFGWRYSAFTGPGPGTAGGLIESPVATFAPTSTAPNAWSFVAVVYDQANSVATMYADIDASTTMDGLVSFVKSPTALGSGWPTTAIGSSRPDNSNVGWNGKIDNVFFFNQALSLSQLTEIRNGGKTSVLDTQAASITLVAVDETGDAGAFTGAEWRTSSVVKPHDLDGDNVLGTDGWKWFGYSTTGNLVNNGSFDEESLPSYIASVGSTPRAWTGSNGWALFDDPLNHPGSDKQGTYGFNGGNNSSADFEISIERASSEAFRLTVFGSVASSLNQFIDLSLDGDAFHTAEINISGGERFYVYFDVPAGLEDLTLRVRRISGDARGITGIAFDSSSIVPEPSGIALAACGLVLFYTVRKRKWVA